MSATVYTRNKRNKSLWEEERKWNDSIKLDRMTWDSSFSYNEPIYLFSLPFLPRIFSINFHYDRLLLMIHECDSLVKWDTIMMSSLFRFRFQCAFSQLLLIYKLDVFYVDMLFCIFSTVVGQLHAYSFQVKQITIIFSCALFNSPYYFRFAEKILIHKASDGEQI